MDITYSLDDFILKVNLSGEIDNHSSKNLIDKLDSITDLYMPNELILDFSEVSFMDSSGIAILIGAYRKQKNAEGTIRIDNIQPQPLKVLKAAGLEKIIKVNAMT